MDDFGDENGKMPYSLTVEDYEKFLISVFDLWYKDIINNDYVSVRMFDNLAKMMKGYLPESCDMMGLCSKGTVIEADGSLYPCDFYVLDEWFIGSIMKESFEVLIADPKMDEFVQVSKNITPNCKACEYYFLCRGGCRRDREPYKEGDFLVNKYCKVYKTFYIYAMDQIRTISALC